MTPEEKVMQKFRDVLIADSVIVGYVGPRVYVSHISSIQAPTYPAISFFLQNSRPVLMGNVVQMRIQIDCWLPMKDYDFEDVLTLHRKLRENLHENVNALIDSTLALKVMSCKEAGSGPLMHEEDTGLYHYPAEYEVVAV
jgi:hypothetical protein